MALAGVVRQERFELRLELALCVVLGEWMYPQLPHDEEQDYARPRCGPK